MYRWWCAASCLPTCSNASILAQRIRRDQTETRSIMTRRSAQLVVGLTCACHLVISKAGNRWSLRARNPAPSIAARERDRMDQSDLIETSADTHALLVCWSKVKGGGEKNTSFCVGPRRRRRRGALIVLSANCLSDPNGSVLH